MKKLVLILLLTVPLLAIDSTVWTLNCARFCAKKEYAVKYNPDTPENVNEFAINEQFPEFVVVMHYSCVCTHNENDEVSLALKFMLNYEDCS